MTPEQERDQAIAGLDGFLLWLERGHLQLEYLCNMPEGQSIQIQPTDGGEPLTINDDNRDVFIAGLSIAKSIFTPPEGETDEGSGD